MKEMRTTLGFIVVAALLAVAAVAAAPRHRTTESFRDQGQPFYPDFKDPLKAVALEVVDFDESTGTPRRFKVHFQNKRWTIPSHFDYPADAKDRLAKTAAAAIDLKKDKIAGDNPKVHEDLGVIDPLDEKAPGTKGRGKREMLTDEAGNKLADFIFGKEVTDRPGFRYVRVPEQKRVYAVKVAADISTKFEDWIETDLLKLPQNAIRKVVVDNYYVDEGKGAIIRREETFDVSRTAADGAWKVTGMKETEEINADNVNAMTGALGDLKIIGVRPKPPVLAKGLKLDKVKPTMETQVLLRQKGYYFTNDGELASNEGEIQAACDDGVVYTLRFGEVVVGAGEEITKGSDEEKKKDEKEKKGGTEGRYLFVRARFQEDLLPALPEAPKEYVADPAKKPEEQKAEEEKAKKDKEEWEGKKKDRDRKIEDGNKRARELSERFADWYYVISGDLFKKLHRSRAELVKPKEPPKDDKKPDEKK